MHCTCILLYFEEEKNRAEAKRVAIFRWTEPKSLFRRRRRHPNAIRIHIGKKHMLPHAHCFHSLYSTIRKFISRFLVDWMRLFVFLCHSLFPSRTHTRALFSFFSSFPLPKGMSSPFLRLRSLCFWWLFNILIFMYISIFLHLARFPYHWLDGWMDGWLMCGGGEEGRSRIYAFILLMPFQPHSSVMTHNHKIVKLVPTPPSLLLPPPPSSPSSPSLPLRTHFNFSAFILVFASFLRRRRQFLVMESERNTHNTNKNCMPVSEWTGFDDEMAEAREKKNEPSNTLRRFKFVSLRMSTSAIYTTVFHCQHWCCHQQWCCCGCHRCRGRYRRWIKLRQLPRLKWQKSHSLTQIGRGRNCDAQFHFE